MLKISLSRKEKGFRRPAASDIPSTPRAINGWAQCGTHCVLYAERRLRELALEGAFLHTETPHHRCGVQP